MSGLSLNKPDEKSSSSGNCGSRISGKFSLVNIVPLDIDTGCARGLQAKKWGGIRVGIALFPEGTDKQPRNLP
jgi:hypothetical protein